MCAVVPGEVGGGVGCEFDGESLLVDVDVVSAAQQDQVVVVGGAAVLPVVDVVGVAPAHGAVAAGEPAAAVACSDLAEQGARDGVGGASEVFGCAVGGAQDDVDAAVAQVGRCAGGRHRPAGVVVGGLGCVGGDGGDVGGQ